MKEKLKREIEKRPFLLFLLASFGFHSFLIIFLLSSSNLWRFFRKDQKITPVSIRVDMVGLPDLSSKKVKAKKKQKKPVVIPNEIKKKPKPKSKKTKIEKKVEKAKDSERQDQDHRKKVQNTPLESKQKVVKGNQLSEGAKEGDKTLSSQQVSEINIYFSAVEGQIKAYWNLPKYLMDLDLTAQIEIKINNKGEIKDKVIVVSSGNDLFDSQVLKAMNNASPYPSPPVSVQKIIQDGIVFTLHSKDR